MGVVITPSVQCIVSLYDVCWYDVTVRPSKKPPTFSPNKSLANSLDLLHQHTLASVAVSGAGHESSASAESPPANHITLPDGCVKAVETLCEKFK